jgi:hypothetical protein
LACVCCYSFSQTALATPAQPASVQELIHLSNAEQLVKEAVKNYAPYFQKHSEQVIKDYTGHQTLTEQDQVAAQKLSKIFVNTVEVFCSKQNLLK